MLRLLFTTKDLSKQMTVITDGIDSQMNVFVTENTVGDVEYYKSLGIVIDAGVTYNIGKFKEWCLANGLGLIGYPEGLEEEKINYVNVLDRTEYTFALQTKSLSFVNTGESKNFVVTSSKQEYRDGAPYGKPIAVAIQIKISGTGFSGNAGISQISATENPTDKQRTGTATIIQDESGKTATISLSQAASVITYENAISANKTTLTFAATAGDQVVTITSTRQKKLNGKNSGAPTTVNTTGKVTGTGFSLKTQSGANYTVSVTENTNETTGRTGTLVVTQEGSEAKSITINLSQPKATVAYVYNLSSNPSRVEFAATGETKTLSISSTKQKTVNGKNSGSPVVVNYTTTVSGTGFSGNAGISQISATENPTDKQRTGTATIIQDESGKTATISLSQAASVITYENAISANKTTLTFAATAGDQVVTITSTRQKKLNGKNSGAPTTVNTTGKVTGTGFSLKTQSGANYTVSVTENTNETTGRTGTLVVTQEGSEAKSITINLSQPKATVAYVYNLSSNPSRVEFAATGETKTLSISSTKQKTVNGKNSGSPVVVNYTTTVSGTGFSKGTTEYSVVAAANTGAVREGSAVVKQSEGTKQITITLSQAAGTSA